MRLPLLVILSAFVAGCASPGDGHAASLDTGLIEPGAEATLTFSEVRLYELHCDPHPFMAQNVTIELGARAEAHVHILDGNAANEFRFEPEELRVAQGARVTYHNHGGIPHTASEMTADMAH